MTAEELCPPYHLFNGDTLQLISPDECRDGGEFDDHFRCLSQETHSEMAVANGSRHEAMTLIEENLVRREKAISELDAEMEPIRVRIRRALVAYYAAVRRHLEKSDGLGESIRNLWTVICRGVFCYEFEALLDDLKRKYFVPDQVDAGLRARLMPEYERLRPLQVRLYRIYERGQMEAQYWSAYLEGMPVAPVRKLQESVNQADDLSIHEKRVLECGRYLKENGLPAGLQELLREGLPARLGGEFGDDPTSFPIQLGTFRKSIGKVKLKSGKDVYKCSGKQGRKDAEAEKATMKRMVQFYLERKRRKELTN